MKRKILYTVIVRTVPEISRTDGGVYTCSIGWNDELGFIRVYPLPLYGMNRWGVYEIEIEKNKRDSRRESWKLASYTRHERFIGFEKDIICVGKANPAVMIKKMQQAAVPAISVLNQRRDSIGFVMTTQARAYWDTNERFINAAQLGLFEDVEIPDFKKYTKDTKGGVSRLSFRDGDGQHDVQLNDWQYYEYQRKNGAKPDAFRYINNDLPRLVMVGNMYQYRSTWLALDVFKSALQSQLIF